MRYGEVSNDLFMRRRMTPSNFWIDGVFDDSEIGNIANYCETLELNDAKIVTDEYVNQVEFLKWHLSVKMIPQNGFTISLTM